MSQQEPQKKPFLHWQKIIQETIEDMEKLHREKTLLRLADIRKERGVGSHGDRARQIERAVDYLTSWGIVDEVTVETCFTCGHELKGPFYILRKLESRYEPYVEPDLGSHSAKDVKNPQIKEWLRKEAKKKT